MFRMLRQAQSLKKKARNSGHETRGVVIIRAFEKKIKFYTFGHGKRLKPGFTEAIVRPI